MHTIWMVLATAHPVALLSVGAVLGFSAALLVVASARRAGRL